MKIFVISALFFAATCVASPYHGVVSTQYHTQDAHGGYSYGYSDPNSQKHETSSHGVTNGAYSYVDGNGHTQSVKYSADPIHGFNAVGTNFPVAPKAVHPIAVAAHAYPVAPATYAHAYSAPVTYTTTAHHYAAAPVIAHHYGAAIAPAWGHHHEIAPITINAHGVPVDTPEVQHAKAAHFAAHAAANHHVHKRSIWGGHAYAAPWAHAAHAAVPVIHNGVPVDTPEVQHAKAAHFAAHAAAGSGHYAAPAAAHHYAPAAPAIHNGHPVDTPEVQHAKAAHFAAVAEAQARSAHSGHSAHYDDGHYDNGHYDAGHYDAGHYDNGDYNPSLYEKEGNYVSTHHGNYAAGHHGAYHIPVIHNGVPVETPEVQHAKAAHFAAVAEAQSRAGHHAGAGAWSQGHDDGSSWNHYDGHHHW